MRTAPYEDNQALGQAAWRDCPVSILGGLQGWNRDLSNLVRVHDFKQELPSYTAYSAAQWASNTIQQSLYASPSISGPFPNSSPQSDPGIVVLKYIFHAPGKQGSVQWRLKFLFTATILWKERLLGDIFYPFTLRPPVHFSINSTNLFMKPLWRKKH